MSRISVQTVLEEQEMLANNWSSKIGYFSNGQLLLFSHRRDKSQFYLLLFHLPCTCPSSLFHLPTFQSKLKFVNGNTDKQKKKEHIKGKTPKNI